MIKKSPKRKPRTKNQARHTLWMATPFTSYGRLSGISDSTRYRWERDGKLPKSFEIEKGFLSMMQKEIRAWAEAKKITTRGRIMERKKNRPCGGGFNISNDIGNCPSIIPHQQKKNARLKTPCPFHIC